MWQRLDAWAPLISACSLAVGVLSLLLQRPPGVMAWIGDLGSFLAYWWPTIVPFGFALFFASVWWKARRRRKREEHRRRIERLKAIEENQEEMQEALARVQQEALARIQEDTQQNWQALKQVAQRVNPLLDRHGIDRLTY